MITERAAAALIRYRELVRAWKAADAIHMPLHKAEREAAAVAREARQRMNDAERSLLSLIAEEADAGS